jgi:RNA polymerase sigma-70 factor (ECF subfamily)
MDRSELEALYAQCGAAVERRCRAILGDQEEARDMVQEVFLRAVTHAGEFRREASPFTWLYRISTNLCLNRVRDRKDQQPIEALAEALVAHAASPERSVIDRQRAERILKGMDEDTLRIVVYRYLDGMTQEEIAEVTGWSRKTLGKKLAAFEGRAHVLAPAEGS